MNSDIKNIVLHDYGGYSFIYQLAKQLSLTSRVFYLYSSGSGSAKGNVYQDNENLKCLDIQDKAVNKSNFVSRLFIEIAYYKKLKEALSQIKADVVISANTPVIPQFLLQRYCNKNKIKFIFWLQDIISLAIKSVLKKKSGFIAEIFYLIWAFFEKQALLNADRIIVISDDFVNFLTNWKIDLNKVSCIPNWAPLSDITPHLKSNSFSRKNNITETFNIVYSGTLGFKHNPDILYYVSEKLKNHLDLKFIIISEGIGANRLNELNERNKLNNLLLLPYQSQSLLSEVYASADIILSILETNASTFSVPSKVWSTYCAARTSLLIVPGDNLAAKITTSINAGIVIDNDDTDLLAEKILFLKNNPEMLKVFGINARKYAEDNFNIEQICNKFLEQINLIN
jgi:colanic acid biosynthesis glycosyl transferase WcaI